MRRGLTSWLQSKFGNCCLCANTAAHSNSRSPPASPPTAPHISPALKLARRFSRPCGGGGGLEFWMLEKLAVVSGMRCRFSTESAERSRVSPGPLGPWRWRRWRGWNLEPLKERVASGESEDPLVSATAGRTHVAGRCVLNWSILLAVLVRSGSAFRPWFVSFRSEMQGASRRKSERVGSGATKGML